MLKDIPSKKKAIIVDFLKENDFATVTDPLLLEALGCSYKTLERYLKVLYAQDLVEVDKRHKSHRYRLKDKRYVVEVLSEGDAFDLSLALESSNDDTPQERLKLIKRIFTTSNEHIKGHLSIFEDLKDEKLSYIYNTLIDVVKGRLYVNLILESSQVYREVKCVKILFIDNNWYVAYEYEDEGKKFRLSRLSFIKEVEILRDHKYSNKNRFQKKEIEHYEGYLEDIQNAFTLYGVTPQEALLRVAPQKAQYFMPEKKKFFKTQQFKEVEKDGSVVFTVHYTQTMEILPFIQQWIPHIEVLHPQELKEAVENNLKRYLKLT